MATSTCRRILLSWRWCCLNCRWDVLPWVRPPEWGVFFGVQLRRVRSVATKVTGLDGESFRAVGVVPRCWKQACKQRLSARKVAEKLCMLLRRLDRDSVADGEVGGRLPCEATR